jgi:hypothetical protein
VLEQFNSAEAPVAGNRTRFVVRANRPTTSEFVMVLLYSSGFG